MIKRARSGQEGASPHTARHGHPVPLGMSVPDASRSVGLAVLNPLGPGGLLGNRLMTVDQVAAYLQVDRATVYRWAAEHDLPAIPLSSKKLRFDPVDIRNWLEERRQ